MNLKIIYKKCRKPDKKKKDTVYDSTYLNCRKCKLIYSDRKQTNIHLGVVRGRQKEL